MRYLICLCLGLAFFIGCSDMGKGGFQELDLLEYGIPLKIQAPDSVEVKSSSLSLATDVTIKGKDDQGYNVQLFSSTASSMDPKVIKAEYLAQIKTNPYFSEVILDEESGFIYKTQLDSLTSNFGFRYVKVQGDKEYIFQTAMMGIFSQEEAERMYRSVQ